MQIVSPSADNTIKVIPRVYGSTYDLVITNNETREDTTLSSHAYTTVGEFIQFVILDADFTFVNDSTYKLQINTSSGQVYRDSIICTDQTIDQTNNDNYSVNNGEYTPVSQSDDEYIFV